MPPSLEVQQDMGDSAHDLLYIVWPCIQQQLGGGEILPVENVESDVMRRTLDIQAGIDAWHQHPHYGLRGIASRVQPADRAWRTFTIRATRSTGSKTEWAKRIDSLLRGWMVPDLWIHSYVSKDRQRLLGSGIVKTKDLILYTAKYLPTVRCLKPGDKPNSGEFVYLRPNGSDGNMFIVVEWNGLKKELVPFIEVPGNDEVSSVRPAPKRGDE